MNISGNALPVAHRSDSGLSRQSLRDFPGKTAQPSCSFTAWNRRCTAGSLRICPRGWTRHASGRQSRPRAPSRSVPGAWTGLRLRNPREATPGQQGRRARCSPSTTSGRTPTPAGAAPLCCVVGQAARTPGHPVMDGEESRRTRQPDVSQPVFGVLVWPGDGRNPGLVYRLSKTIMKKSRSGGRRVTVRYSRWQCCEVARLLKSNP